MPRKKPPNSQSPVKLSPWLTVDGHCATRVRLGTDPSIVANRFAFIEKTPRVRMAPWTHDGFDDHKNWREGPKGSGVLCGEDPKSRAWCDEQLLLAGYILGDT